MSTGITLATACTQGAVIARDPLRRALRRPPPVRRALRRALRPRLRRRRLCAYRMARPAPRAVSAVAATARVKPALILVFRRLLLSATPTTLPLAAAWARAAAVSQNWIPVNPTAGVAPLLKHPVQPPATVLPGSSANRLGTRTSVLWRAKRDDSQGSILTQRDLHRRLLPLGTWVSEGKGEG
jgi:hypothetical protein